MSEYKLSLIGIVIMNVAFFAMITLSIWWTGSLYPLFALLVKPSYHISKDEDDKKDDDNSE